jgi:hypothetical protein
VNEANRRISQFPSCEAIDPEGGVIQFREVVR